MLTPVCAPLNKGGAMFSGKGITPLQNLETRCSAMDFSCNAHRYNSAICNATARETAPAPLNLTVPALDAPGNRLSTVAQL